MSWQDDVDKKLEALIAPHEAAADALIEHAHCNPYNGPPMQGDMYCGWPVRALIDLTLKNEQARVAVALKNRFTLTNTRRHNMPAHTHSLSAGSGGGGAGAMSSSRPHSLEEMMSMRMRWGALMPGANAPWAVGFAHMAMHQAGDAVHVWIITKDGKSIVLEDEQGLYPSDALVTKIRLLQRGDEG